MIINKYGIAFDGVEVPDNAVINNLFRVRVIKVDENDHKECVGEEDYMNFPSDDSLMYCITKYKGSFAVVENIHFIEKLPFSEE